MCGIAGLIGCGSSQVLQRMTDAITHRGPDAQGHRWFEASRSGFGHRRLSIIDLSTAANQPLYNDDGSLLIIFNGEIFNFNDVKQELAALGHSFRTHSDTEVAIKAYQQWGPECLRRFNGMFAFAIWDEARQRLFLARDRLGVKPLYYWHGNGALVFASEIKAILASGLTPRTIDQEALSLYLSLQYVPAPKTMFSDIRKMYPGHYMTFDRTGLRLTQYWQAPYGEAMDDKGLEAHCAEFRDLLRDAIKIRMISDVPIGAFLSGGIDSSIVVSQMATLSSTPIQTYSVGFVEGGRHFDELEYAEIVSRHCGTNHRTVVCSSAEAAERIPELVYYLDEPVNETLIYPYNKVSRLAKQTATVVLTGEGADEFLHGYRQYSVLDKYRTTFQALPAFARHLALAVLSRLDLVENAKLRILAALLRGTEPERLCQWATMIPPAEQARLLGPQRAPVGLETFFGDFLAKPFDPSLMASYFEHRYRMVDYILMRTDKMSMETALECRTPLLDYRVVEYMVRLPKRYKNPGGVSKLLLRQAYQGVLPESILTRRKKPFAAPIHQWLHPLCQRFLQDPQIVRDGIVTRDGLARYLVFDRQQRAVHSTKLWLLVMLEIWYRAYFTDKRI